MTDTETEPTPDEKPSPFQPPDTVPQAPEPDAEPDGDEPDEEDGQAGEDTEEIPPDEQPKPPPEITPQQMEKRFSNVARSWTNYLKWIDELRADDVLLLTECPLCPDQHKGFVNMEYAGRVPEEIQDAVRMFFGIAREQDYELDTDYRECPKCKGKGMTSLPTHVAGKRTRQCSLCLGNGYLPPAGRHEENGHEITGPTVFGEAMDQPQSRDDVDEWGEPRILPDGRENPNFGKMPNRKILVDPWGQTAHLNAFSS